MQKPYQQLDRQIRSSLFIIKMFVGEKRLMDPKASRKQILQ
jgi:hypothetical protein